MASATACMIEPAARSSSRVVKKVASVSPPDAQSIRSSADFTRILEEGKRIRSGGVVVVRSYGEPGLPRFGLIIPKQAGNAVTRNRIKRRLRPIIRDLELEPGTEYVIIASPSVADAPHAELVSWLRRATEGVDG